MNGSCPTNVAARSRIRPGRTVTNASGRGLPAASRESKGVARPVFLPRVLSGISGSWVSAAQEPWARASGWSSWVVIGRC